jgi:uncharacterized protein YndB with AHSA1/START domain
MPATAQAAAAAFEIDRANFTIRFERLVDAPPSAVFDAWTKPEELSQWWDPAGRPLLRCDIDLRVGGRFAFVTEGHPEMPFTGAYREIRRASRLVFDGLGAVGTVMFEAEGTRTRLTVLIRCPSAEQFEQFLKMGVADGTAQTLDNLVAFACRPPERL